MLPTLLNVSNRFCRAVAVTARAMESTTTIVECPREKKTGAGLPASVCASRCQWPRCDRRRRRAGARNCRQAPQCPREQENYEMRQSPDPRSDIADDEKNINPYHLRQHIFVSVVEQCGDPKAHDSSLSHRMAQICIRCRDGRGNERAARRFWLGLGFERDGANGMTVLAIFQICGQAGPVRRVHGQAASGGRSAI